MTPSGDGGRQPIALGLAVVLIGLLGFIIVQSLDDNDNGTGGTGGAEESDNGGNESTAGGEDSDDGGSADGSGESEGDDNDTIDPETPEVEECDADTVLCLGALLPLTGELSADGPARQRAFELAVERINEAGGVGDRSVDGIVLDSGLGSEQATLLVAAGVDVIIVGSSSQYTLEIIDEVTNAGVVIMSSSNTSQDIERNEDNPRYFRTAPSDLLQGRVLANQIAADHQRAAVLYRDDAYGRSLAESFRSHFAKADRSIVYEHAYQPLTSNFDGVVTEAKATQPDIVLVVGFDDDAAAIVEALDGQDIGPNDGMAVWGVDGNTNIAERLSDGVDRGILRGMKQTVPAALVPPDSGVSADSFAAETYDATVIVAVAAEQAFRQGGDLESFISDVTRQGLKCSDFATCAEGLQQSDDIDYDGLGGQYELTDSGEPSVTTYRIDTYGADGGIESSNSVPERLCVTCAIDDLEPILFADGSAVVDLRFADIVDEIADVIKAAPVGLTVEVQGYASSTGTVAGDQELSEQRAAEVYQLLIDRGVSPDKIEVRGYGQTEQFGEESNNRRVKFEESFAGG